MCDPVTATGLALSAGGTFLQSREADKNAKRAQQAKEGAFTENINRNARFADEAGAFQKTNTQKAGRENFDAEKDASAQDLKQAFTDIRTQPDYNVGAAAGALPKNVVMAREAASKDAGAKTDRDVDNLSQLQGYGGALFNQGMDQSAFARLFGGIQDKAGANTRLMPLEMNAAAANSQKAPSLFPTLMKLAGTGMSMYGAGSGTTSFFDKTAAGPLAPGQTWGDLTTPGLFTKVGQLPGRIF
jgi:hypothetical protein